MNVLYIEDDIDDYGFFVETLADIIPEAQCANAINGLDALQMLEDRTVEPDVIVLDINMPTMDGKICLKALKTDMRYKDIPVYIYTTAANPLDIAQCRQLGAADYLRKPTSIVEARKTLEKIFQSVPR